MSDRMRRTFTWAALVLFFVVYIIDPTKKVEDETARMLLKAAVLRAFAILVFVGCVLALRYRLFGRLSVRHLAVFLPAMAVALNNFPWIPLLTKDATIVRTDLLGILLFHVLCVGILEELAFRGVLLPLLLNRFGKTKRGMWKSVILSSVIFGFVHFMNLIEGAGVGVTLMQVGYSMLTGSLCAVLFLKTGNLLECMIVHSVFNFGGGVTAYMIQGRVWNLPNVLCTVSVAVLVGLWTILVFVKMAPEDLPHYEKEGYKQTKEIEGVTDDGNDFGNH